MSSPCTTLELLAVKHTAEDVQGIWRNIRSGFIALTFTDSFNITKIGSFLYEDAFTIVILANYFVEYRPSDKFQDAVSRDFSCKEMRSVTYDLRAVRAFKLLEP